MNVYGINSLLAAIYIETFYNLDWKPLVVVMVANTLVSLSLYDRFSNGVLLKIDNTNSRNLKKLYAVEQKISKFKLTRTHRFHRTVDVGNVGKIDHLENKNKYDDYMGVPVNTGKFETRNVVENGNGQDTKGEQKHGNDPVTENELKNEMNADEDRIKKENDMLTQKIKEQRKILRKKIEIARRNAYITRKPEEIEKTEKIIKDILDKYDLTEESLNDNS
jgi:hypothetical protein